MAMDDRDESLARLAGMLGGLADEGEPMTVGEMDGFVTGLVVYPEHVPPSEWLTIVWGADTEFRSSEEAKATASALIQHYNSVARTLAFEPERYGPVLEVVEGTDEVLWEAWIEGFARTMRLRPGAWARIKGSDELDVIEAVHVIHTLYAAANGTSKVAAEGLDLLDSLAPTLIGGMVQDLNVHMRSRGVSADALLVPDLASALCGKAVREGGAGRRCGKAVREAPCGCGAGRAYHCCCGAH